MQNRLKIPIKPKSEFTMPYPNQGSKKEIMEWSKLANQHDDAERKRIENEFAEKLEDVFAIYKIRQKDKQKWEKLAINLAKEKYVGLTTSSQKQIKKQGRKIQWKEPLLVLLWLDIQALLETGRVNSVIKALRYLIKTQPWRTILDFRNIKNPELAEAKLKILKRKYELSIKTPQVIKLKSTIKPDSDLFAQYYAAYSDLLSGALKISHEIIS